MPKPSANRRPTKASAHPAPAGNTTEPTAAPEGAAVVANLAVIMLLEQIGSPLVPTLGGGEQTERKPVTFKDMAAALFIFTNPQRAFATLAAGRPQFDAAVFTASCELTQEHFAQIMAMFPAATAPEASP